MQSQIVAGVSITCNQTNNGYNSLFNSYDLELLDTKVNLIFHQVKLKQKRKINLNIFRTKTQALKYVFTHQ